MGFNSISGAIIRFMMDSMASIVRFVMDCLAFNSGTIKVCNGLYG